MQLRYPGENLPLIDSIKTEAFVNGIRDSDIKLVVCCTKTITFAEILTFVLAQETARTISRLLVSKVRTMVVVEEHDRLLTEFKEMVNEALHHHGED